MNKIFLYIYILLFISISSSLAFLWWKNIQPISLCRNLSCIHMNEMDAYTMQDIYSDTPQIYRALFSNKQRLLRIEASHMPQNISTQQLNASIMKEKAMFEKAPAPYPGEISDAIVCDPSYIPTYEEMHQGNSRIGLFIGYLNNRMTFGSCSQDQAVYKGALALMYCQKNNLLLRVELITSITNFTLHEKELIRQIKSLECGK